jgi:hypothetical protein
MTGPGRASGMRWSRLSGVSLAGVGFAGAGRGVAWSAGVCLAVGVLRLAGCGVRCRALRRRASRPGRLPRLAAARPVAAVVTPVPIPARAGDRPLPSMEPRRPPIPPARPPADVRAPLRPPPNRDNSPPPVRPPEPVPAARVPVPVRPRPPRFRSRPSSPPPDPDRPSEEPADRPPRPNDSPRPPAPRPRDNPRPPAPRPAIPRRRLSRPPPARGRPPARDRPTPGMRPSSPPVRPEPARPAAAVRDRRRRTSSTIATTIPAAKCTRSHSAGRLARSMYSPSSATATARIVTARAGLWSARRRYQGGPAGVVAAAGVVPVGRVAAGGSPAARRAAAGVRREGVSSAVCSGWVSRSITSPGVSGVGCQVPSPDSVGGRPIRCLRW